MTWDAGVSVMMGHMVEGRVDRLGRKLCDVDDSRFLLLSSHLIHDVTDERQDDLSRGSHVGLTVAADVSDVGDEAQLQLS